MPGLSFNVVISAVLVVFALAWCKEAIQRFGKDVAELRAGSDWVMKGVIVIYWLLTLGVMSWLGHFVWSLLAPILRYL